MIAASQAPAGKFDGGIRTPAQNVKVFRKVMIKLFLIEEAIGIVDIIEKFGNPGLNKV
jgi:hypothetical protein